MVHDLGIDHRVDLRAVAHQLATLLCAHSDLIRPGRECPTKRKPAHSGEGLPLNTSATRACLPVFATTFSENRVTRPAMGEHAIARRDMAAHDVLVILDPAVVTGKDEIVRLSSRRRFTPFREHPNSWLRQRDYPDAFFGFGFITQAFIN